MRGIPLKLLNHTKKPTGLTNNYFQLFSRTGFIFLTRKHQINKNFKYIVIQLLKYLLLHEYLVTAYGYGNNVLQP